MNSLRLTLYEIFGYLVPGILLVVELAVFMVLALQIDLPSLPDKLSSVAALIFLSYLAGHTLQSLANVLEPWLIRWEREEPAPLYLQAKASAELASRLSVKPDEISALWLYRICDAFLGTNGKDHRETYQHRSALYRGLFIAYLVGVPLFTYLVICPPSGAAGAQRLTYAFCAVVLACLALLALSRYYRFTRLRKREIVLRFLALQGTARSAPEI